MERRIRLLFGILGSLLLIGIKLPQTYFYSVIGNMDGYVSNFIANVLSLFGLILLICLSILLIVDCLKAEVKRKL